MLIKSPKKSILIHQLEALLGRLSTLHPKRHEIEGYLARLMAGFRGEKAMEYYFKFLPEKSYFIFHNLRLPYKDTHFQIDLLIITPKFTLVSEVKNYLGSIFLDKNFKQLIQTKDGIEKAYQDPLIQVEQQRNLLKTWLRKHKFPNMPIEKLVIFTNPNTIMRASQDYTEAFQYAIHKECFLQHIRSLEEKYQNEVIELKEIKKLSRLLMKSHTPNEANLLERYQIREEDIQKGVQCTNPDCQSFPMLRQKATWVCAQCGHIDKLAHHNAITDYRLLINSTITNKQLREFLFIASSDQTRRLLLSLNLNFTGANKNRMYELPKIEE